jgi:hypothetical protein
MNIRKLCVILVLLLSLLLTGGLIVLAWETWDPVDRVQRLLAPGDPVAFPAPNTHTAPTTATVSITYNEPISAATVSTRTFAVHAMQTGLLTQTYGVVSGAISLTPTLPFKPGELVQVSATTGTLNLSGEGPISPTVWQFWAGVEGGTGLFGDSGQRLGDGGYPGEVALGDLDGDGDLDACVANLGAGEGQPNTVWMNDGRGIFTLSQVLDDLYSYDVALGDLDGDGDLDALVANGLIGSSVIPTSSLPNTIWMNDGTGVFTATQKLGDSSSTDAALGDLDGDGDLDAFVPGTDYWDPGVGGEWTNEVWLNDGRGVFTCAQSLGGLDPQTNVTLGDLDQDGDLDAFAAGPPGHVWLNDGTGVFSDTGQSLGSAVMGGGGVLGDLDGDGDLDALLVESLIGGGGIGIWMNDGTGHFYSAPGLGGEGYPRGVAVGDLDGDGDLDVFTTNAAPPIQMPLYYHWVEVWLNEGGAQGGTPGHFSSTGERLDDSQGRGIALGDVNGDGDLDAFVTYYLGANKVWLNQQRAAYLPVVLRNF